MVERIAEMPAGTIGDRQRRRVGEEGDADVLLDDPG
jgi:hypothetical protein